MIPLQMKAHMECGFLRAPYQKLEGTQLSDFLVETDQAPLLPSQKVALLLAPLLSAVKPSHRVRK